eukprot:gene10872-22705_t
MCASLSISESDITPLDRLVRMKPMITKSSRESDSEGLPSDDMKDIIGDDGDESDPRFRIGKHLLSLGKVHYRHIETIPEWIQEKQAEISRHRTSAQIRRCMKNWMLKPERELQTRYIERPLGWNINKNSQASTTTDSNLDENTRDIHAYGPEETIAYSHYFFPSRFAITKRILNECKQLIPEFIPTRVLDFGCGPATGGAAVACVWEESMKHYSGVDISRSMLDAAKIMLGDSTNYKDLIDKSTSTDNNDKTSTSRSSSSTRSSARKYVNHYKTDEDPPYRPSPISDCKLYDRSVDVVQRAISHNERFDMAILSYTLTDLMTDSSRRAAVQLCFELLDENGILVIVDTGNPFGSHSVRSARKFILDTFNSEDISIERNTMKRGGQSMVLPPSTSTSTSNKQDISAHILSPCTHDLPCPLSGKSWCSFSQKVHSGMIRKGSEEKFSYVIIQKRNKSSKLIQNEHDNNKIDKNSNKNSDKNTGKNSDKNTGKSSDKAHIDKKKFPVRNAIENTFIKPVTNLEHKWTVEVPYESVEDFASNESETSSSSSTEEFPRPLSMLRKFIEISNGTHMKNVFGDGNDGNDDVEEAGPRLIEVLVDKFDWEEYKPDLHRSEWSRVIRSPLKAHGHTTLDLCNPTGHLSRIVLSRSTVAAGPTLYTALRKTTWGGLFPSLTRDDDDYNGYDDDGVDDDTMMKYNSTETTRRSNQQRQKQKQHQLTGQKRVKSESDDVVEGSVSSSSTTTTRGRGRRRNVGGTLEAHRQRRAASLNNNSSTTSN